VAISFEHKSFLNANYMTVRNEWCDDAKKIGSLWFLDKGEDNKL
jgi:hypothetical protein